MPGVAIQDDTGKMNKSAGGRAQFGYKPKTASQYEEEQRRVVAAS